MNSKHYTVNACRWFDSSGNTYHSVRCTRHSDGAVIANGWHYGYGDHYKQTALQLMFESGWFGNTKRKVLAPADDAKKFRYADYTENTLIMFERENKYPIIWNVSDGLKRDMVANGTM